MIVYLNGRFMPKDEARISPDDRGFLFADGVYEVVRAYCGRLFLMGPHLERLERSLRLLRISQPEEDFAEVARKLLRDNGLDTGDATVYIQITRGAVSPRKHAFPDGEVSPTVYAAASPFEPVPEKWEAGVRVVLHPDMRWARCDIKSLALLPNVLAAQYAREHDAEEAVLVRDGMVTEGSHTSFCAVYDGTLVTSPKSNYILGSITRDAVLDLCRKLEIPVREFPIQVVDLSDADECMILGTGAEVTPVVQIDDRKVGNGTPGPVTRRLLQAYRALYEDPNP